MRSKPLSLAIEKAGGVNALARKLGISSGAVAQWRDIPPRRLGEVARATGLPIAALAPELQDAGRKPGLAKRQATYDPEIEAFGLDAAEAPSKADREAIGAERARRWREENREAIEAHNRWVEENGLPLDEFRMF